jgi:LIM domain-containing protein
VIHAHIIKKHCIAIFVVVICVQGPTEAERKIEELTRQLEEEMEKQEEEGEYFGKLPSLNFQY